MDTKKPFNLSIEKVKELIEIYENDVDLNFKKIKTMQAVLHILKECAEIYEKKMELFKKQGDDE